LREAQQVARRPSRGASVRLARRRDHHPGPALLHTVEASTGLTGQDLTAIATWLTTVA